MAIANPVSTPAVTVSGANGWKFDQFPDEVVIPNTISPTKANIFAKPSEFCTLAAARRP